jgi:hypothetical protein
MVSSLGLNDIYFKVFRLLCETSITFNLFYSPRRRRRVRTIKPPNFVLFARLAQIVHTRDRRSPQGVCHTPLRSDFLWEFILRPLRSFRPIPRIRNGPIRIGPYFVTYMPFVVKRLFPFGCGFTALGP